MYVSCGNVHNSHGQFNNDMSECMCEKGHTPLFSVYTFDEDSGEVGRRDREEKTPQAALIVRETMSLEDAGT